MPQESSLQKSEGRSQTVTRNQPRDNRYNAALQLARQLNADNTRAIKPSTALSVRHLLPVAIGVTSVAGTALAGVVTLLKVMRRIERWRRSIQAASVQESIQESEPESMKHPDHERAIAVFSAVEICVDPTHSALTVYSRTMIVRQPDGD